MTVPTLTAADLFILGQVFRDAHRQGQLSDAAHDRVVTTLAGARLHVDRMRKAATR